MRTRIVIITLILLGLIGALVLFHNSRPPVSPVPPAVASATSPATAPATSQPAIATQPAIPVPAGYALVWHDEFDTDGPLNPKDWTFEQGFVRNQELQWYQPDNARISNGNLVIEARRETKPNPTYRPGSTQWQTSRQNIEYTAASVNTRNLHSFLYGRFEIRARIDTRSGSWPAFWLLGTRGPWPANGEIDVMEYYRNMVLANVAWAGTNTGGAQWNSARKPLNSLGQNWSSQFHTWRMDWDENRIALYLDDQLANQQDLSTTINSAQAGGGRRGAPAPGATPAPGGPGDNPFHHPMYILLNLAIGGQQGGDPANTPFPIRYEIDYLRVYQKPAEVTTPSSAPARSTSPGAQ